MKSSPSPWVETQLVVGACIIGMGTFTNGYLYQWVVHTSHHHLPSPFPLNETPTQTHRTPPFSHRASPNPVAAKPSPWNLGEIGSPLLYSCHLSKKHINTPSSPLPLFFFHQLFTSSTNLDLESSFFYNVSQISCFCFRSLLPLPRQCWC